MGGAGSGGDVGGGLSGCDGGGSMSGGGGGGDVGESWCVRSEVSVGHLLVGLSLVCGVL